MKRIVTFFLVLLFLLALAGTGWFLWSKSRTKPKIYETETAQLVDIVKKTVATGAIVPRREVEIKPRNAPMFSVPIDQAAARVIEWVREQSAALAV